MQPAASSPTGGTGFNPVLRAVNVQQVGLPLAWITLAAWSVLCTGVLARDWPQWGGRDERNMVSDEKGLPESFVPGEKKPDSSGIDLATTRNVRWVARLGSQTFGNPTVAGGRVFVGTNDFAIGDPKYRSTRGGLVKCLDESTGKLLWQLVIPKLETNKPEFNFDNLDLGVCSSPTVEGNRVYLVTNRCEVICLDVTGMANGNDGPVRDEGQYTVGPGQAAGRAGPARTATSSGATT